MIRISKSDEYHNYVIQKFLYGYATDDSMFLFKDKTLENIANSFQYHNVYEYSKDVFFYRAIFFFT